MVNKTAILPATYLGNIDYFSKLISYDNVLIESFENYSKQTYRNRCEIYSANGILSLSIPVSKESKDKVMMKDLKIAYNNRWQQMHWRAITSAYNCSPFFLYYQDYLIKFYEKQTTFLIDFNIELTLTLLKLLKVDRKLTLTDDYQPTYTNADDYRDCCSPKRNNTNTDIAKAKPYTQVFGSKFGFKPNLSIIDLLFNEGTHSVNCLK